MNIPTLGLVLGLGMGTSTDSVGLTLCNQNLLANGLFVCALGGGMGGQFNKKTLKELVTHIDPESDCWGSNASTSSSDPD